MGKLLSATAYLNRFEDVRIDNGQFVIGSEPLVTSVDRDSGPGRALEAICREGSLTTKQLQEVYASQDWYATHERLCKAIEASSRSLRIYEVFDGERMMHLARHALNTELRERASVHYGDVSLEDDVLTFPEKNVRMASPLRRQIVEHYLRNPETLIGVNELLLVLGLEDDGNRTVYHGMRAFEKNVNEHSERTIVEAVDAGYGGGSPRILRFTP